MDHLRGSHSGCTLLRWPDLCEVVWQASSTTRLDLHLSVGKVRCPTPVAPYGRADPRALRLRPDCRDTGCLDLYHDVLLAARQRLERASERGTAGEQRDPRRYTYVTVTHLLADLKREQRVRQGLPARPGRLDGEASHVVHRFRATEPGQADWYIALFRMIRDYAHKPKRAAGWPYDGWTLEKSRWDGRPRNIGDASRDELRADVAAVLRTARDVLGDTWVHLNVTYPLVLSTGTSGLDETVPAPPVDLDSVLLGDALRRAYGRARRDGLTPVDALDRATQVVAGRAAPPLTPDIRSALRELDHELSVS